VSLDTEASVWFAFRAGELLVVMGDPAGEGHAARVPTGEEWAALGLPGGEPLAAGTLDGAAAWAVGIAAEADAVALPEGLAFLGLRRLWGVLGEAAWKLAGRAAQIVEWDLTHRYCGRCGAGTERQPAELSRVCPRCGLQQFPRISPAVIMRVERGEQLLLARSPHFAPGVYSTLAGFVEPGESLEEAVAREVREEVGVEVRNVRYFGSQPWPFPHSLMIGFVADWDSGEIRPQEGEIEDAGWFGIDALPGLPSRLSIARALLDDFISRRRP
jgi:NAD+ diphosphatase